jgi:hypothetical protein
VIHICRWKDNTIMNSKQIRYDGIIRNYVHQERDHKRALPVYIMKLVVQ